MSSPLNEYRVILERKTPKFNPGLSWQERSLEQDSCYEEFKNTVIRFLNKVVGGGGVICLGKRELRTESSFYCSDLNIKIPENMYSELSTLDYVIDITKVGR